MAGILLLASPGESTDTLYIVGKQGVGVPARDHDSEAIPAHYFLEIFQPEFFSNAQKLSQ
jgi:hypothetical protein